MSMNFDDPDTYYPMMRSYMTIEETRSLISRGAALLMAHADKKGNTDDHASAFILKLYDGVNMVERTFKNLRDTHMVFNESDASKIHIGVLFEGARTDTFQDMPAALDGSLLQRQLEIGCGLAQMAMVEAYWETTAS